MRPTLECAAPKMMSLLVALGLNLMASTTIRAREISGELHTRANTVYEGFAYEIYKIETSGKKLSVSMNASNLDAYLILCSPDKTFLIDDDGGEGHNARIEVSEPGAGTWIAIATSLGRSVQGPYSLVVEGASGATPLDVHDVDADVVEAAFSARGVVNAKRERARKVQMLKEQLTLRSVREQLTRDLSRDVGDSTARAHYQELEAREQALEEALDESNSLKASRDLVRGILEAELSSARRDLESVSKEIERRVKHREAYKIALEALHELDDSASELSRLENLLVDPKSAERVDLREIQLEIGRLRTVVDELAESIATRLVDSSFVRQLSFSIVGDHRVALQQAHQLWGFMGGHLGGLGARRPGMAAPNVAASGMDARTQTDPSIWLPELFPWPPPEASSRVVLDGNLIPDWRKRMKTLGDVDDALTEALGDAGYSGPSYFGVKDGFALVAQLEQTNADGVPLDGVARWSTGIAEMKDFSLPEYLRALLTAPPGYYRVLTFIATSIPFSATGARGRFATIERWARTGHNHLPDTVRAIAYSHDHRVTVLVYEFLKERAGDEPLTSVPGRLTATEHLKRSTVLASLR